MVTTRAKYKKIESTLRTCFSQASTQDYDHEQTEFASLIGSNDDILTQILLRLPITSILRFKSVSKHWRSFLSHTRFTLLYDNLLISPGLFHGNIYIPFHVKNQNTPPFRCLDFHHDLNGIRIVQSCNGLLLCCSERGQNERSCKLYVFNPTTKQYAIVPWVSGGLNVRKTICFLGLVFHPTSCVRYKVVCIHRSRTNLDDDSFQVQIYSSNTRKWKILDNHIHAPGLTTFTNGVYWKGAIHWAHSYFDLNEERFEKLSLPSPLPMTLAVLGRYSDENQPVYFGESRGHLHLVDYVAHESHFHINVYEMLGDHSGWFVKYKVDVTDFLVVYSDLIESQYASKLDIIDVVRGEKEEDAFIVLKISHKIIRYNVADKSFELLFDLSDAYLERTGYAGFHRYIQSLTLF